MAAALAILMLAAIVAGLIFIHTSAFDRIARKQLVDYASSSYRAEFTVGRVAISGLKTVVAQDVSITYGDAPLLKIPRLELHFSLVPLLWRAVHLRLVIHQPRIQLAQDSKERWNLVEAFTPKNTESSSSNFSIYLDRIAITDGSIEIYRHGATRAAYAISGTTLLGRIEIRPRGIQFEAHELVARLAAPGFSPASIQASFSYQDAKSPASVKVTRLLVSTEKSKITLVGSLRNFAQMNLAAQLSIDTLAPADLRQILPGYPLQQNISGKIVFAGGKQVLTGKLELASGDARAAGNISVNLTRDIPAFDAKVALTRLDLRDTLGAKGMAGTVKAQMSVRGAGTDLASLVGKVAVNGHGVTADGWNLGDVAFDGELAQKLSTLQGTISGPGGRLSYNGSVTVSSNPRYRIALTATHLNLRQAAVLVRPPTTDLNFKASFDGSGISASRIDSGLTLELSRSAVGRVVIDRGNVTARVAAGKVDISNASVTGSGTVISANGVVPIQPRGKVRVSYKVQARRLDRWFELAGMKGSGRFELSANASGPLSDLSTRGTLQVHRLHLAGYSADSVSASYDLTGFGRGMPQGNISTDLARVEAGVSLKRLQARLQIAGQQPVTVNAAFDALDSAGRKDQMTLRFQYEPDRIKGTLSEALLTLPDGEWRLVHPAAFSRSTSSGIRIQDLQLRNGARQIAVDGTVGARGQHNMRLRVEQLDLAVLKPVMPAGYSLGGALSADVRVTGTSSSPSIEASLGAEKIRLKAARLSRVTIGVKYRGDAATIDARIQQDSQHQMTVTGTVPLKLDWSQGFNARLGRNLDLRIFSAGLKMDPLAALAPATVKDASGLLKMDLAVRGPVWSPSASGTVGLVGGKAKIVPLGVQVTDVDLRTQVTPDQIKVLQLSARSGDGTLRGTGTVAMAGRTPGAVNLHLDFDRWPALNTSRYQFVVQGNLAASGTQLAPNLTGKIEVVRGTVHPDLSFLDAAAPLAPDETITVIEPGQRLSPDQNGTAVVGAHPPVEKPKVAQTSGFNRLAMDVKLIVRRNTWIRHERAAAELEGRLDIIKRPQKPVELIGKIQTVRGWLNFEQRRFDLVSSLIQFTGGGKIDPSLNIDGRYKLTNYIVDVIIGGTASKPTINLTSQPDLPQADILSLLLFGRTTSALTSSQRSTLRQQASNLAVSAGVATVGKAISKALGLQAFGVQLNEIGTSQGAVGLGHYFGENTYVSASQQVQGAQGREVSVQYYLTRWLSVKSTTSSDGSHGIAVSINKQY